ncbi:MAG: diguanylate cyclase [Bryobacteraceae bacterium]|nr:diguanylate cyclase [Bryobacteraceae bacterium]
MKAQIYVALITLLALATGVGSAFGTGPAGWECRVPMHFLLLLAFCLVGSTLKIRLPGIVGSLSVSYIFVLIGVLEMSLGETLALGMAGALVGSLWKTQVKARPIQICFNVASLMVSSAGSWWAFRGVAEIGMIHPAAKLACAAIAYYVLNTFSVSIVVGLSEGKSAVSVWRAHYTWAFPNYILGASVAGLSAYLSHQHGWTVAVLVLPVIYAIYHSFRIYLDRIENEKLHAEEMSALHLRTIEALALAIEAKDDCTSEHLSRVQVYALEIGRELGLDAGQLKALQAAAILHDIGKLAVPDYIISKPGKLTADEFEKMKIHPVVGAEILERVQFPYPVAPIVRSHHEKWDGSGYPSGLRGEQIPIGARILSTVDCLDALASDRQYRRAMSLEQSLKIVQEEAGKAFDARVVEILVRRASELEVKAKAAAAKSVRLNFDMKIERGEAPAAGFEQSDPKLAVHVPDQPSFVASIARARHEVSAVYELTHELGSSLSLEETLSVLGMRLKAVIPHDCIAIYLRRDDTLYPAFVSGENASLFSSLEIPLGQGLSGWVLENHRPVINGNPSVEPGYLNDPTKFSTLRSALAIPLTKGDHLPAVLTLYHADRDAFHRDHLRILQGIQGKLSLALANALKFREAQAGSSLDPLTGALNARALFFYLDAELSRAKRAESALTLFVCDMNGFKALNDQYGHNHGDRLLRRVATHLKEMVRGYDGVGRLGGDEFVVVMPGLEPGLVAGKIAEIEHAIATAAEAENVAGLLNCCTGHASFPQDGQDAEDLLAVADQRLYQAKCTRGAATQGLPALENAIARVVPAPSIAGPEKTDNF